MQATTFIGTIAVMTISIGVYILMPLALSSEVTVRPVVNSKLEASDRELCKQYRKWQAMPEIKGVTTSMDVICERLGQ